MKIHGSPNRYAYNAPAVADAQAGVIVACEVTRHENDGGGVPEPAAGNHRTAFDPDHTTQELLALDGLGSGAGAHAVGHALHHLEPARPLRPLARGLRGRAR